MALLEIKDLVVSDGGMCTLQGVSFAINEGEVVTLLGAKGSGKSTLLRTISALQAHEKGQILYAGLDIAGLAANEVVRRGIVQVPEGRRIFDPLTVRENLELGAFTRRDRREIATSLKAVFRLFPRLKGRMEQCGGSLSAGEQQMLALGRALMADPKVLLLDEPAMGLSPILVEEIFDIIREINSQGVTILLAAQNVHMALSIAQRACVLEAGVIKFCGLAEEIAQDSRLREVYLGSG